MHQYGVHIQSSSKVPETFRANNLETVGHNGPETEIVYILVFYNMSFSWLLPLEGFQFIFLLRDSENDLYPLGINECQVNITTINIKERKALANLLVQNSRAEASCIMVFTCRVSLSGSLESEASLQSSL